MSLGKENEVLLPQFSIASTGIDFQHLPQPLLISLHFQGLYIDLEVLHLHPSFSLGVLLVTKCLLQPSSLPSLEVLGQGADFEFPEDLILLFQ